MHRFQLPRRESYSHSIVLNGLLPLWHACEILPVSYTPIHFKALDPEYGGPLGFKGGDMQSISRVWRRFASHIVSVLVPVLSLLIPWSNAVAQLDPASHFAFAYQGTDASDAHLTIAGIPVPIIASGHYDALGNHDASDPSFLVGGWGSEIPPYYWGGGFRNLARESRGFLVADFSAVIAEIRARGIRGSAFRLYLDPPLQAEAGGFHLYTVVGFTQSLNIADLTSTQTGRVDLFEALRGSGLSFNHAREGWISVKNDLRTFLPYMAYGSTDPIAIIALQPLVVPEPEIDAMLVAGLGAIGVVARRRRTRAGVHRS